MENNAVQYPPMAQYLPTVQDDELRLIDLWCVLLRKKWLIAFITTATTGFAIWLALWMTPVYRAEVLMVAVQEEQSRGFSGQLGGLASLAGINLKSAGSNKDTAIATITSRIFVRRFIMTKNLMPILFASRWDQNERHWRTVDGKSTEPTFLQSYNKFIKIFSIKEGKRSGLVTLSVQWTSPELAAEWANELVDMANNHIRSQSIQESEKSIHYLQQELEKTSLVDMQRSLFRLIEEQTKDMMLANVRDEYAFKIIDPAVAPENRFKPNRRKIVIFGFILGLMASIALVFLLRIIETQKNLIRAQ